MFLNKADYRLAKGGGRTKIYLAAWHTGDDLLVYIYNKNIHLGAVAIGEFDNSTGRTTISIISRLGHKDDAVAQRVAYAITKHTKRATCVVAGIHVDAITQAEIAEILANGDDLIQEFVLQKLESEL